MTDSNVITATEIKRKEPERPNMYGFVSCSETFGWSGLMDHSERAVDARLANGVRAATKIFLPGTVLAARLARLEAARMKLEEYARRCTPLDRSKQYLLKLTMLERINRIRKNNACR